MGWLWLVGSIKLQVSLAKEPYERDDILQKRRIYMKMGDRKCETDDMYMCMNLTFSYIHIFMYTHFHTYETEVCTYRYVWIRVFECMYVYICAHIHL